MYNYSGPQSKPPVNLWCGWIIIFNSLNKSWPRSPRTTTMNVCKASATRWILNWAVLQKWFLHDLLSCYGPSTIWHFNTNHGDVINGSIFRVTGLLCGKFTGPRWIPLKRPVTRSFEIFFDLYLNKQLSKQSSGWWFETPSCSLWRHCNVWVQNANLALFNPSVQNTANWNKSAWPIASLFLTFHMWNIFCTWQTLRDVMKYIMQEYPETVHRDCLPDLSRLGDLQHTFRN